MIALLKYGTGVPFKRLERLQEQLGMPLPATTQWDLMAAAAKLMRPVLEEFTSKGSLSSARASSDPGKRWPVIAFKVHPMQIARQRRWALPLLMRRELGRRHNALYVPLLCSCRSWPSACGLATSLRRLVAFPPLFPAENLR